jgi:hypothetical protein
MPVGHLLRSISSRELTEWRAWELVAGPLGAARGDWQTAHLASVIATVMSSRRYTAADLMPVWDATPVEEEPGSRQTPEQMLAIAKAIVRSS